jgi:26S proteasome regulatory subunit N13
MLSQLIVLQNLILFPPDASFVGVPQASGRVYVLKFSSSDQRHFVSAPDRVSMMYFTE